MLSHIKDNNGHYSVIITGKPYTFDPSHTDYDALVECVKVGDIDAFMDVINTGVHVENWSEGNFNYLDGFLYYEDEPIRKVVTRRILEMIKGGWDHKPMLQFLDRLYANPSNRAVTEFYDWIQHKGLAITNDGYIVGYKGVAVYDGEDQEDKVGNQLTRGDSVDKFTGRSFRNNIGDAPEMKRRQVDDNCNNGCSHGLHVGTYEYACDWAGSGGRVVLVKVDPADVVSIPVSCNFQKMRCWKYEVIAEARGIIEEPVYSDPDEEYNEWLEDEEDFEDYHADDEEDYDADIPF